MGLLTSLKTLLFGESVDYNSVLENGGLLIDVRTPAEFHSGHAKRSKNIPLSKLSNHIKKLEGKEVVLVCKSGARAAQARNKLMQNGIKAYNAGSWRRMN